MDGELSINIKFDLIDALVFAGTLGVSVFIGVYQSFKSRKNADAVNEYLVGGREMSIFPISMSLIASYISGIFILGVPAEIYVFGTQFWATIIPDCFVSITMAIVYLPVFYGLKITSSYEYLKLRFNNSVRLLGSVIFVIRMVMYLPLLMYVPALAFNQVTGVNLYTTASVSCAICIFYTTVGGFKAVVWSDTFQTVVMFGGVTVVSVFGTIRVGGFSEVWKRNEDAGRIEFFNMDTDPTVRHTFWSVVIGSYFSWLSICSINQAMVQRCLAMKSLKDVNTTLIIMAIGIVTILSLGCYTGIVIFASYYDCDPIQIKKINKSDQILPYFVMEMAESMSGLPGLFVSCIFSAALSTMSTVLNAMSGIIYNDMIKPYLRKPITDINASRIMKLTSLIIGLISVGLIFLVEKLSGLVQAGKSLSSITSGPLLGIFSLGMFFPIANSLGAAVGGVVGVILIAWISLGTQHAISMGQIHFQTKPLSVEGCPEPLRTNVANFSTITGSTVRETPFFLYRMSYQWYTLLGFLITVLVGLIVSWISGPTKFKPGDKKLYTPVIHRWLPTSQDFKRSENSEYERMRMMDQKSEQADL